MRKSGCKTINMRSYKLANKYIVLMNAFSGNLLTYLKNINASYYANSKQKKIKVYEKWFKACEEIRKIISCLLDKKIYYTDLKPENILYCDEDDDITFYVGDLGGAFIDKGGEYIRTYQSPEMFSKPQRLSSYTNKGVEPRKMISYLMGIMAVFPEYEIPKLSYNMKHDTGERIYDIVKTLVINKKTKGVILKLLKVDPNDREDLKNVKLI